jgi:hypothetical protein
VASCPEGERGLEIAYLQLGFLFVFPWSMANDQGEVKDPIGMLAPRENHGEGCR